MAPGPSVPIQIKPFSPRWRLLSLCLLSTSSAMACAMRWILACAEHSKKYLFKLIWFTNRIQSRVASGSCCVSAKNFLSSMIAKSPGASPHFFKALREFPGSFTANIREPFKYRWRRARPELNAETAAHIDLRVFEPKFGLFLSHLSRRQNL